MFDIDLDKSGIYKISLLNDEANRFYIGSAVNIRKRWIHHKSDLNNNIHRNNYLQNVWNKYGENSFNFEVVEFVEIDDLLKREQHYLDLYKPFAPDNGFNICKTAGNLYGTKRTEEFKIKKSEQMKKYYENHDIHNKGIPMSDEQKQKISETMTNRYDGEDNPFHGKIHTNESKAKMARSTGKLSEEDVNEIIQLLNQGILFHREIAEIYNVSRGTVTNIKNNRTWLNIKNKRRLI